MIGLSGYNMTHIHNLRKQNEDYYARQVIARLDRLA